MPRHLKSILTALLCGALIASGCALTSPKPGESWSRHVAKGDEATSRGEVKTAEREYLAAISDEDGFSPADPRRVETRMRLADLFVAEGRLANAESRLTIALAIQREALGSDHVQVARTLDRLGIVRQTRGNYAGSMESFEEALAIRRGMEKPADIGLATTLEHVVSNYLLEERYADARPLLEEALEIRETVLGVHHPGAVGVLEKIAAVCLAAEEYENMVVYLSRSLLLTGAEFGADRPDWGERIDRYGVLLGEAVDRKRDSDLRKVEARKPRRPPRPVASEEPAPGEKKTVSPETRREAEEQYVTGVDYLEARRYADAARVLEIVYEAIPDYEEVEPKLKEAILLSGMEHYTAGRPEEAIRIWERILEIDPQDERALSYLNRTRKAMQKAKDLTEPEEAKEAEPEQAPETQEPEPETAPTR